MLGFYTKRSKLRLPLSHHDHFVAKVMNQKNMKKNGENKNSKTFSAQQKKNVLIAFCIEVFQDKCGIDTPHRLLIIEAKQQQVCLVCATSSSLSGFGKQRRQSFIFNFFVNISKLCHNKSHPGGGGYSLWRWTCLCCAHYRKRRIREEGKGMERQKWWGEGLTEGAEPWRDSKRDGGRGGHRAAVFWLLSKGSVASSEQTKYWSQLNITFPSVR